MDSHGGEAKAHSTAEAVARRSYGKLVAFLSARTHDVAAAEDALSEAFASALLHWPNNGCPANPEAWLLTVARRKFIDATRRQHILDIADEDLEQVAAALTATVGEEGVPDRRLALMFACAHPAVDVVVRAPLILQVILGLDAGTIASAFLMSPSAIGKRLVRAKNKIRRSGIPFRLPDREELPDRLEPVLEAIYAASAAGWSDAAGTDPVRSELSREALFLARLISELLPDEPEALGLLALMLYTEGRRRARRSGDGEYVCFAEQDVNLWNTQMISEAEALLSRASTFGRIGRYQLEASVQSAHVHRRLTGISNWASVLQLYDALFTITGSPVVAINRALAIAELRGPQVALDALPNPAIELQLAEYQPYWAAKAELLAATGSVHDAERAYQLAIGLEGDSAVRQFLAQRLRRCQAHTHQEPPTTLE